MKTLKDAEQVTPAQLREMTPPQVDELFAAACDRRYDLVMKAFAVWDELHYAVGDRRTSRRGWGLLHTEAEKRARESTGAARRVLDRLYGIKGEIAELDRTVLAKLENEFDRRGGWSRAYLVTDGHVHSSQRCSSCNRGEFPTQFSWMIDFSGKSHEEIIEAAGHRACSICYPDAPVNRGKQAPRSIMFTPEERERERLREEEATRQAEKKAKAAAKAITLPDGTPLRDEVDREGRQTGSIIKTLRTARSELKRECWRQYAWGDDNGSLERNIRHLGRAVAWKENGLPVGAEPTEEQITAVIKSLRDKALKELEKARREQR